MVLSTITSTLSMLATLAIAYGIDRWIYGQLRLARQTGNNVRYETWIIVGGLVLLLVWLLFSWLILTKARRIPVVSIIYIVVGLLAFLWFPLQLVSVFWIVHLFLFPFQVYNLQYTGLFITALGVVTLLFPKGAHTVVQ